MGTSPTAPIAKIATSGGLMIAVNSSMPNMPRLDTVAVAPVYSSGASLRSRARFASSRESRAISLIRFLSASAMIGVMSPSSTATAMPRCTRRWRRMLSPSQCAFTSGCWPSAVAIALSRMSLYETLNSSPSAIMRVRNSRTLVRSKSAVRKKVGIGPFDSASRRAMVLRICVSGRSSKSPAATTRGAGAITRAAAGVGAPESSVLAAASMSRRMTRPPGPVPWSAARSSPRSVASRRASGEERARPPPFSDAGAAEAAGGAGATGALGATGAADLAAAGGATAAAAAAGAFFSNASMFSSAAAITASRSPTGRVSPSAARRARSTPSPRAVSSITALSVSTSARRSPFATVSPSFFNHLTRRPSSIVGESASIVTFVAITSSQAVRG